MDQTNTPRRRPVPPQLTAEHRPGRASSHTFDRVRLEVDAGSFAEPVTLTVEVPGQPPPIPEYLTMPYVFRVQARNGRGEQVGQIDRPVRFTVEFGDMAPHEWGQNVVSLYYFDEAAARWTRIPSRADMANRRVTAEVEHFTDFGFATNANELPSTPPNLQGFDVDLCTGHASAAVALRVPPGTNGLQPDLTLRYNSGAIDQLNRFWIPDGANTEHENGRTRTQATPVGLGWTLDLGAIFSGGLDAQNNAQYYLVLHGRTYELARVDNTNYRTKPDDFMRIRKLTGAPNDSVLHEYWLVEAKDGTQYRFGYNRDSEQLAAAWQYGGTGQQYAWQFSLDQIKDSHGNTLDVAYTEVRAAPNNQYTSPSDTALYDQAVYPSRISYGGNPGQAVAHNREITFVYSARSDWKPLSPAPYTQYCWKQKLDRVEMRVGGQLVRAYDFGYTYKQSRWYQANQDWQLEALDKLVLTALTEKDAGGAALPATTFTYWELADGIVPGTASEHHNLQLKRVENGYGGSTTFAYQLFTPGGYAILHRRFRVGSVTIDPGTGGATDGDDGKITRSLFYGASRCVGGYDYRGHDDVTVTDAAGHFEKSSFYTDGVQNGKTVAETAELQSRCYKHERSKKDATAPTAWETTDWTYTPTAGGATFVFASAVRRYLDSAAEASSRTTYAYDAYGNPTDTYEYDDASAAEGNWVRHTQRWFYPAAADAAGRYLVGLRAGENLYRNPAYPAGVAANPDGTYWERSTLSCYDGSTVWNQAPGSGVNGDDASWRGRLTRIRRGVFVDVGGTPQLRYAETGQDYDGFGNKTATTLYGDYGTYGAVATADARTATCTYEGAYHTFPETVTYPTVNGVAQTDRRTYDPASGLPLTLTDANGRTTTYTYDTFKRLTGVLGPWVGPVGQQYRSESLYVYDASPTTVGGRTTFRILKRTRTDNGGTAQYVNEFLFHDGLGRLVQRYQDAVGGHLVVNRHYDRRGLLLAESVPHLLAPQDGSFAAGDWGTSGQTRTWYEYDHLRRELKAHLPGGLLTERSYWARKTWLIDQNRHTTRQETDALGRLTAVVEYLGAMAADLTNWNTLPVSGATGYAYNVADQLTGVTDAAGNQTAYTYDLLGRKVRDVDPDLGTSTYGYDCNGNLLSRKDARNKTVSYLYDKLNRLVSYWYPMQGAGFSEWTEEQIVGGRSRPTIHDLVELRSAVDTDYAAIGRTDFGNWTNDVAIAGRVVIRGTHFWELRQRLQVLWTAANLGAVPEFSAGPMPHNVGDPARLIKASDLTDLRTWLAAYEAAPSCPGKARAYYGYDTAIWGSTNPVGRRTWSADMSGRTVLSYDEAGRVADRYRRTDGTLYHTAHAFDALGRVRTTTLPDGEPVAYAFRTDTLLQSVSAGGTTLVSVPDAGYNDLLLPRTYAVGGGNTPSATWSFDYCGLDGVAQGAAPYGAPRTSTLRLGAQPPLVDRTLGLDGVGNVASLTDRVAGPAASPNSAAETISYGYDELDRLVSASAPVGESYAYGPAGADVGNMASRNESAIAYGDAAHKHAATAWNGFAYTYDARGNLVSRTGGGQPSTYLRYDPLNRLVRVSRSQDVGATICRYTYDGDGVRTKRLDTNGTVHYLGDYERNVGYGDGTTDVVTKYYYASVGNQGRRLVAFRRGEQLFFVGTDHLGSTIRVADANFSPVDRLRYRPFGGPRDPGTALNTDRKFTGQTEDGVSGLYFYQARYYDAGLGRFVQPDSVVPSYTNPQGLNRYGYCANNPLRFTDPTGHAWEDDFASEHGGRQPTTRDRDDRDFSTTHPGSGPGGAWTRDDWETYTSHGGHDSFASNDVSGGAGVAPGGVVGPIGGSDGGGATLDDLLMVVILASLAAAGMGVLSAPRDRGHVTVFRVWGGQSPENGRSWTMDDPRLAPNPPGYRSRAGLPDYNTGDHLTWGMLWNEVGVKDRPAIVLNPGQAGGWQELVVPWPAVQVIGRTTITVDPAIWLSRMN